MNYVFELLGGAKVFLANEYALLVYTLKLQLLILTILARSLIIAKLSMCIILYQFSVGRVTQKTLKISTHQIIMLVLPNC